MFFIVIRKSLVSIILYILFLQYIFQIDIAAKNYIDTLKGIRLEYIDKIEDTQIPLIIYHIVHSMSLIDDVLYVYAELDDDRLIFNEEEKNCNIDYFKCYYRFGDNFLANREHLIFGLQGPFLDHFSFCKEGNCDNVPNASIVIMTAPSNSWLLNIKSYKDFYNTIDILKTHFFDLSRRLNLLHTKMRIIKWRFGAEGTFIQPLKDDIKRLSNLGMKLATARVVNLAKY